MVGLIDDIINVRGSGLGVAGLPSKLKILLTTAVALVGGLFFYFKLDVASIHIPGGSLHLGWLIIQRTGACSSDNQFPGETNSRGDQTPCGDAG